MAGTQLSRPDLVLALERAAEQFSQHLAHKSSEVIAKLGIAVAEALAMHEAGKELVSVLSAAKPFLDGTGFMVARPNGYSGFHASEASLALLKKVSAGQSAHDAVLWLDKLLETPSASGLAITALWGIECQEPVDLGNGVHLLPITFLRDSPTKEWILRPPAWDSNHPGSVMPWRQPTAAVSTPATVAPLLFHASAGSPPPQQDPLRLSNLLDDARLALSLCGPSHPLPAAHWFELDDPDLQEAFRYGGISRQHIEVIPIWFDEPHPIEHEKAKRVVSGFFGMAADAQAVMRLALGRFNQALRRPSHGDRALELAISLESLLVDNAGENTFKFALRAALLLGGTLEERAATRSLVSALYSLRSTLVHDGVLPQSIKVSGEGKRPSIKVVDEVTNTAGLVLERIIELGQIPDWYSLELGEQLQP